jgi:hypothetical protein
VTRISWVDFSISKLTPPHTSIQISGMDVDGQIPILMESRSQSHMESSASLSQGNQFTSVSFGSESFQVFSVLIISDWKRVFLPSRSTKNLISLRSTLLINRVVSQRKNSIQNHDYTIIGPGSFIAEIKSHLWVSYYSNSFPLAILALVSACSRRIISRFSS